MTLVGSGSEIEMSANVDSVPSEPGRTTLPRRKLVDILKNLPGEVAFVESEPCIDLNAAPLAVLEPLPHIGPARAGAIVEGRPWEDVQELTRIHGLGELRSGEFVASTEMCED